MASNLALTVSGARELTPSIWGMINEMAPVLHRSRLFGVTSVEAAAAIMLKGYELGLSITASFEFIHVVEGRPSLKPMGALALLHASPEITKLEIHELLDKSGAYLGHTCTMARRNGFEYTAAFTMEDAHRAGLVKPKSGWENYPRNMCMWRAVGFAADVVAPDITAGMTAMLKMPEQFGMALTQDGDIIDVTPVAVTEQPAPAAAFTLENLLDLGYTAEQILVANEGRLPMTDEDVLAVAQKLAAI